MTTTRIYFRCNSEHLFNETVCPFDGWSMDGLDDVKLTAIRLEQTGGRLSMDALRAEGIPNSVLKQVLIVEFGSPDAVFESLEPNGYWIRGKWMPISGPHP